MTKHDLMLTAIHRKDEGGPNMLFDKSCIPSEWLLVRDTLLTLGDEIERTIDEMRELTKTAALDGKPVLADKFRQRSIALCSIWRYLITEDDYAEIDLVDTSLRPWRTEEDGK